MSHLGQSLYRARICITLTAKWRICTKLPNGAALALNIKREFLTYAKYAADSRSRLPKISIRYTTLYVVFTPLHLHKVA